MANRVEAQNFPVRLLASGVPATSAEKLDRWKVIYGRRPATLSRMPPFLIRTRSVLFWSTLELDVRTCACRFSSSWAGITSFVQSKAANCSATVKLDPGAFCLESSRDVPKTFGHTFGPPTSSFSVTNTTFMKAKLSRCRLIGRNYTSSAIVELLAGCCMLRDALLRHKNPRIAKLVKISSKVRDRHTCPFLFVLPNASRNEQKTIDAFSSYILNNRQFILAWTGARTG
jgi:hypothetical protein